jgi:hypothetical protein
VDTQIARVDMHRSESVKWQSALLPGTAYLAALLPCGRRVKRFELAGCLGAAGPRGVRARRHTER